MLSKHSLGALRVVLGHFGFCTASSALCLPAFGYAQRPQVAFCSSFLPDFDFFLQKQGLSYKRRSEDLLLRSKALLLKHLRRERWNLMTWMSFGEKIFLI